METDVNLCTGKSEKAVKSDFLDIVKFNRYYRYSLGRQHFTHSLGIARSFHMKRFSLVVLVLAALSLLLVGALSAWAAEKIKIEKLDDLPRHTYKIGVKAVDLLDNDQALQKLAGEVKKDLEDDLAKYDIGDKTTLKEYYASLGTIALLNNQYDVYLDFLKKRKDLEDKAPTKMTMGQIAQSYIVAKQSGKDFKATFTADLKQRVEALPYSEVDALLKQTKAGFEMMSKNLSVGGIESSIQPILDKSNGEMSKDIALGLIQAGFTIRVMLPLKEDVAAIYGAVIDAQEAKKAPKPDIWAGRDVKLTDKDAASPVIMCVWDSGVDVDIFKNQMWTNTKEIPGNNKDDDDNGYVDDVHGIAYGLHSDKEIPLLYPIGDVGSERPKLQRQMKGLEDLQASIESPEAQEIKQMMASLPKDSVKPVFEGIGKYGNYCHGTHVSGISVHDNPFARILAARLTFDYHVLPELPTMELAQKDAKASQEFVDYFKKNGVRVVNMSWGNSLGSIEGALEANNAGATPEERKKMARELYEVSKKGLFDAIKNAPDILFVTSAGNANNDVNFDEFYPSSFALPNVLTVGAVDQAGDETSFTSFGKVDVYANGFEVLSYVPGGDQMKLSGTSMSSPNVMNLAGKLLAKKPGLTVAQLKDLIIKGCDEKKAGERKVMLINPQKSFELLAAMK
jgi:subtilisin family serine protease